MRLLRVLPQCPVMLLMSHSELHADELAWGHSSLSESYRAARVRHELIAAMCYDQLLCLAIALCNACPNYSVSKGGAGRDSGEFFRSMNFELLTFPCREMIKLSIHIIMTCFQNESISIQKTHLLR